MIMTAYDLVKELIQLEQEVIDLGKKLSRTGLSIDERNRLEREIDIKFEKQLVIKNKLEKVKVYA